MSEEKQAYDVDLEQLVLGSCFRDNVVVDIIRSEISAEAFYDPLHQRLFAAMLERRSEGLITPRTLYAFLHDDPGLATVGGLDYLEAMRLVGSDVAPIRQYGAILRELALKRNAIQDMEDAVWVLKHTAQPVAKAIASVVVIADQAAQAEVRARPVAADEIGRRVIQQAERAYAGERIPFVTTGLQKFDDAIGGMQAGDLIIVPGRSGMGKTALLSGMSYRAAAADNPTLVFSLEMMAQQWVERILSDIDYDDAVLPIGYGQFRRGSLSAEQLDRAVRAATALNNLSLEICDAGDVTVEDIAARARAFKAKHPGKLGVVLVDYLQRIQPSSHKDRSREQEVSHISRTLKNLAKSLEWPVVAAAQLLTKGGDPRQANKEQIPTLAAIRESGQIEMDADIIMAPHRKAWFLRKERPIDFPDDSPEMVQWRGEYRACKNILHGYGLKMRHGGEFDLDLWCDMRGSAIRDEEPRISMSPEERAGRDLLDTI